MNFIIILLCCLVGNLLPNVYFNKSDIRKLRDKLYYLQDKIYDLQNEIKFLKNKK